MRLLNAATCLRNEAIVEKMSDVTGPYYTRTRTHILLTPGG